MYAEPTISPNFVIRQKRKLIHHPIVIGGISGLIVLFFVGMLTVFTRPQTNATPSEPELDITFESRIVFNTTPTAESTQEPDVVITAPLVNVSQPISNEGNTLSSQTASRQPSCRISSTGDANVNIRSGPDLQFSLISSLNDRTTVDAIAMSNNRWFQITNSDGTIGWVGGSVVDESGECDNLAQIKMPLCTVENTTGNLVNIRDGASLNANVIRTLSVEDHLMADGHTEDGWYRILITGELGWIYQDVVALSDGCQHVPVISANEPLPQAVASTSNLAFDENDCVIKSFTGNTVDLREGPGMEFAVIAKMNKAMAVSRLSTNGWYEIDDVGWAFAGELVYQGLCNVLPTVSPEEVRGTIAIMSRG